MASAIGAAGCWELDGDADVQRIAANTIDTYVYCRDRRASNAHTAPTSSRPSHSRGVGSVALVAVLYTTPVPPPLLTLDNET